MKRQNINRFYCIPGALEILSVGSFLQHSEVNAIVLIFQMRKCQHRQRGPMTYRDPVSTDCWDQDSQPRLPDSTVHVPTPAVHSISPGSSKAWRVSPSLSPLKAHAICGVGLWTPEFWVGLSPVEGWKEVGVWLKFPFASETHQGKAGDGWIWVT